MRSSGKNLRPRGRPDADEPGPRRATTSIGRSLDLCYRDADRTRRIDRLNAAFLRSGGLTFDLGAHVGDRTASFTRLGATVVALEPQPRVFRALRLIHGRERRVILKRLAVGARPGRIDLYLNSRNPTVSTASRDLIASAAAATGWREQVWDGEIRVPVTTLDQLISEHGLPDFVKIDVEGHELEVLLGLGSPLPALSFEITTVQRHIACRCLERLSALGHYEFNISLSEEHRLRQPAWIGASDMRAEIARLPDAANSGDIYARVA